MAKFMKSSNFSHQAIITLDKLCQMTDGSSADRYSLWKFLHLLNNYGNYYQPAKPNDQGLWKEWKKPRNFIIGRVKKLDIVNNPYVVLTNGNTIFANNIVLCIPPINVAQLVGNLPDNWVLATQYDKSITVVFHWDTLHNINNWGFPHSDIISPYGIIFVILSNYMDFDDLRSKTVISCSVNHFNIKGFNGKTIRNSTKEEFKKEIWTQLNNILPALPPPTYTIIDESYNSAYIRTPQYKVPVFKLGENLYTVGGQNENSNYPFTSFESAVENSILAAHILEPNTKEEFPHIISWLLMDYIFLFIILLICSLLIGVSYLTNKYFSNSGVKDK
jgi:hypothetical protein